ncbi:MAG: hypothetical protein IPJ30_01625 [Acidobacteria bacterium]|nr:hypothetical protein [Acidobacteriota bacterium]
MSQTITVQTVGSNPGFTAVQTYSYDSLNRIKDATENLTPNGGTSSQTWKQTFTYDRYGNRNFDEANTTTIPKNCTEGGVPVVCDSLRKAVNPSVSVSTNRVVSDQDGDTVDDYLFDPSGNMSRSAENNSLVYDAENKLIQVKNASNQTIGQYSYDGNGKRVKKFVPQTNETTIFVYDASGKLVAEYSTILSQSPQVSYLTNDILGSPRITTDRDGNVFSRRDFMPFGEDITSQESSQRTATLGYAADSVRKKFTGYERDEETDLDFAQARYYTRKLGRFVSVDPISISDGHKTNPQRWNLYVYAVNCPTGVIDPDGKKPKTIDIFVVMSKQEEKDGLAPDLNELIKLAKGKEIKVRIFRISDKKGSETEATLGRLGKSLRNKDTAVIIVGHSTATTGDDDRDERNEPMIGNGIMLTDGELQASVLVPNNPAMRADYLDKINASGIMIFTCNNGSVNREFAKRMSGELITFDNGKDGRDSITISVRATYAAAETLINGGDMKQASESAQREMNNARNPKNPNVLDKLLDGDRVVYQDLRGKN